MRWWIYKSPCSWSRVSIQQVEKPPAGPSLHATPSTPCNPVTWLMQPRKYPKMGKFDQKVAEIGDFRSFLRPCNPVNFGNGQNKDAPD